MKSKKVLLASVIVTIIVIGGFNFQSSAGWLFNKNKPKNAIASETVGNKESDIKARCISIEDLMKMKTIKVAIRSKESNKYVSNTSNGRWFLKVNKSEVNSKEKFQIEFVDSMKVAIKSLENNKYVTAEAGGILPLIANRKEVNKQEIFEWNLNADLTISFKSLANNKYVSNKNGTLKASESEIGDSEKFYCELAIIHELLNRER